MKRQLDIEGTMVFIAARDLSMKDGAYWCFPDSGSVWQRVKAGEWKLYAAGNPQFDKHVLLCMKSLGYRISR